MTKARALRRVASRQRANRQRTGRRHSAAGRDSRRDPAEVSSGYISQLNPSQEGGGEGPNTKRKEGAVSGSITMLNPTGRVCDGAVSCSQPFALQIGYTGSMCNPLGEPPGADPHAGWCGEGRLEAGPYPIADERGQLAAECGVEVAGADDPQHHGGAARIGQGRRSGTK